VYKGKGAGKRASVYKREGEGSGKGKRAGEHRSKHAGKGAGQRACRYALAAQDGGELAVHGGKVRGIYKNE
jgi:hypothetical protein